MSDTHNVPGEPDALEAQAADEDTFVVPPSWLDSLFPRRGGDGAVSRDPDPAVRGAAQALLSGHRAGIEAVLRDPRTDPAVATAGHDALAGRPCPLGAAAIAAALASGLDWDDRGRPGPLADLWLDDHGLPFAAAAAVELLCLGWSSHGSFHPRVHPDGDTGRDHEGSWWVYECAVPIAARVRAALAAAPDAGYTAAVAALDRYRRGTGQQRVAATFLAPTETDWHDGAVAALTGDDDGLAAILLTAVTAPAHVTATLDRAPASAVVGSAAIVYTFVAGVGPAAAPALAGWFDGTSGDGDAERRLAQALAALPGDEPFRLLLERADRKHVPAALRQAAGRFPVRALRLLAGSRRRAAGDLLQAHVLAHPEVVQRALPALPDDAAEKIRALLGDAVACPEAPAEALPELLVNPPWTTGRTTRRAPVVPGLACPDQPAMAWAPGERQAWFDASGDRPSPDGPDRTWASLATSVREGRVSLWEEVDFFVDAPFDVARPLIEGWRPRQHWHGDTWMPGVISRFELAALPAALDAARRSPATMAGTLLPYAVPDIALLMADWHGRLTSTRAAAQTWLLRHAALAARALIPPAVGRPGAQRRAAEQALRLLAGHGHADAVRTAADQYGAAASAAVDELLAVDPLDLLPARVPKLPEWADPGGLPRVRLRDGSGALPVPAAGHVATMLAMSRPGDPYAGVAVVKRLCEPRSLAEFAWALFQRWQAAGAPAKDSWALNALGLLGDDETVRRLAPIIRDWPGEARRTQARTGLDVLATIGTAVALTHLHGIAQKAHSAALQDHAKEKMRAVAASLDLQPEQLAEQLVPDLGLDASGGLTLDYGPRQFVVGPDGRLERHAGP